MEKKTTFTASEIKELAGTELTLREGKALELREETSVKIAGTLKAPYQFLDSSKIQAYKHNEAHLLVDRLKGTLMLLLNERSHYKDNIFGELKIFEPLKAFKINEDFLYSTKDLIRLLKRNKFYFESASDHEDFLTKLNNFSASINTKIKDAKDKSGSTISSIEKEVTSSTGAPMFKLKIPVYQGYPPIVFKVEVCLDATDSSISFFLESPELFEQIDKLKQEYLDDELAKFKGAFMLSIVEIG
jgi:hypothetical protein